ncbi:hypothetical protein DER44DRAFT_795794 [Fusarium oxysporum]|nr:hypothetical protein DER44DRAFT_795794 [Fusarium oxysporum]
MGTYQGYLSLIDLVIIVSFGGISTSLLIHFQMSLSISYSAGTLGGIIGILILY